VKDKINTPLLYTEFGGPVGNARRASCTRWLITCPSIYYGTFYGGESVAPPRGEECRLRCLHFSPMITFYAPQCRFRDPNLIISVGASPWTPRFMMSRIIKSPSPPHTKPKIKFWRRQSWCSTLSTELSFAEECIVAYSQLLRFRSTIYITLV
jgi:hypothetical protein